MKVFTARELAKYNGKKGKPAYVGYKGRVYDVTGSFHWKEGRHWVLHDAGLDLTDQMKEAPHFDDLLLKFAVVGQLSDE
jgi:predicted heme/steroid binding protein